MNRRTKIIKSKQSVYLLAYIALYFVVNCLLLVRFPVMHSDESWLSGLTRTMMHEGMGATEYFFDLLSRYPHAIKSIFHILQMPFILVFGYNFFAVRLLSLIFGIGSLVLIYSILDKLINKKWIAFLGMVLVSVDIQFIYVSHFARQEIVIIFLMLLGMNYIISNVDEWKVKNDIITACIIGIGIGIHPNSFILAFVIGSIYIYYIVIDKKIRFRNLIILIGGVIIAALVFVGISYLMNDNFIQDYLKYGDDLGATQSGIMKLFLFPDYYRKLFNGFSVTYYLPDIRLQFVLFGIWTLFGIFYSIFSKNKKALIMILPLLAVNIGILAIGRFSQPSIALIFPFCYMMIIILLDRVKRKRVIDIICILVVVLVCSIIQIVPVINNEYNDYLDNIKSSVPSDAVTLANLNAEYAFTYDKLHDYRNLDGLGDMKFAEYIYDEQIEYIVYPEEMDFIYDNRPVWNVVYGNVYPYYDDMQEFFRNECEMIAEFESPYAMRILMFSEDRAWSVKVYSVIGDKND